MDKGIKEFVLAYFSQDFKHSGLSCYRDFAQENKLLQQHALGLKLWIACHLHDRWTDFFPRELLNPGEGSTKQKDCEHTSAKRVHITKKSPIELLKACPQQHHLPELPTRLAGIKESEIAEDEFVPGMRGSRDAIYFEEMKLRIACNMDPRLYLPVFWKSTKPQFTGYFAKPVASCLYFPPPKYCGSEQLPVIVTDDLLCAEKNHDSRIGFRWCSFYSCDGTGRGVDFSPLKGMDVIVIVYPRVNTSDSQQIQRALQLGENLKMAGVLHMRFASFIPSSQPPVFSVRPEPILLDENEIRGILSGMDESTTVFRIPFCLQAHHERSRVVITEKPNIQAGTVISLTGGKRLTQLRFLNALLASIAGPRVILPAMQRQIHAQVLWFLDSQDMQECQDQLRNYGVPEIANASIPSLPRSNAMMQIWPVTSVLNH